MRYELRITRFQPEPEAVCPRLESVHGGGAVTSGQQGQREAYPLGQRETQRPSTGPASRRGYHRSSGPGGLSPAPRYLERQASSPSMSDLSVLVPWLSAGLISVASIFVGRRHSASSAPASFFYSAIKALGLGIASIFLASAIHTGCIETFHLCRSRGDGNITYALGPVLGIPLYWLLILAAAATSRRPAKVTVNPHRAAVDQALSEYRQGAKASSTCPTCGQPVSITSERASSGADHLVARCNCGRCNERFSVNR